MSITEIIRSWRERRNEHADKERVQMLNDEFRIIERKGTIYLTAGGIAFAQVESDVPAGEIVNAINTARLAAIKFGAYPGRV